MDPNLQQGRSLPPTKHHPLPGLLQPRNAGLFSFRQFQEHPQHLRWIEAGATKNPVFLLPKATEVGDQSGAVERVRFGEVCLSPRRSVAATDNHRPGATVRWEQQHLASGPERVVRNAGSGGKGLGQRQVHLHQPGQNNEENLRGGG